jgi:hypothetical protein
MLELSTYRLRKCRASAGLYDFFDPETGRLVGVASLDAAEPEKTGRVIARLEPLFRSRWFARWFGPVIGFGWFLGAIAGLWSFHPKGAGSRLIVRQSADEGVVFTLRESPGLLYDSRSVYDGDGSPIAFFRSHFKTTVRGGFGIIDLMGEGYDRPDIGDRPWLGQVEPHGDAYRFTLVGETDAGRIAPHEPRPESDQPGPAMGASPGDYDVGTSARLQHDPTGKTLLLAAALTIAWGAPPVRRESKGSPDRT